MFPNICKRPWKNIDAMIIGFLDIVDGLVGILSLGFVDNFNPTMRYLVWRTNKQFQQTEK